MKVNLNELICELYMHKFVIFLALFHNFVPLYKGVKPLKFSFKKKKTIKKCGLWVKALNWRIPSLIVFLESLYTAYNSIIPL